MRQNLCLSDSELAVVIELLMREQRQLLVEIRHTDHAAYRHRLQERLVLIDSALEAAGALEQHPA